MSTLDVIFATGQTLSLEIKMRIKNKDGSYTLTLPDGSEYIFNPQNALLYGFVEGSVDDKAKKSSALSS